MQINETTCSRNNYRSHLSSIVYRLRIANSGFLSRTGFTVGYCSKESFFVATVNPSLQSTVPVNVEVQLFFQEDDIISCWLRNMSYEDYASMFINAGYDLLTISRMTPQVFLAILFVTFIQIYRNFFSRP